MAKHLRSSALIVAAILIFGACSSVRPVKPGGWGIGGSAAVRGAGSERAGRECAGRFACGGRRDPRTGGR